MPLQVLQRYDTSTPNPYAGLSDSVAQGIEFGQKASALKQAAEKLKLDAKHEENEVKKTELEARSADMLYWAKILEMSKDEPDRPAYVAAAARAFPHVFERTFANKETADMLSKLQPTSESKLKEAQAGEAEASASQKRALSGVYEKVTPLLERALQQGGGQVNESGVNALDGKAPGGMDMMGMTVDVPGVGALSFEDLGRKNQATFGQTQARKEAEGIGPSEAGIGNEAIRIARGIGELRNIVFGKSGKDWNLGAIVSSNLPVVGKAAPFAPEGQRARKLLKDALGLRSYIMSGKVLNEYELETLVKEQMAGFGTDPEAFRSLLNDLEELFTNYTYTLENRQFPGQDQATPGASTRTQGKYKDTLGLFE
jgi:hypothetical protein